MRPLLCKLGWHKPAKEFYIRVRKTNGKHKWHTNYVICARCGKRLRAFGIRRQRNDDGSKQ